MDAVTTASRDKLKEFFGIRDATIYNGVYRVGGTHSIWLFVTRRKTRDRTPYEDQLEGKILRWQGQLSGRTDRMIIEHEARGFELLVFFREHKYEHAAAGFRYEGPFRYQSHEGAAPTSFVLERAFIYACSDPSVAIDLLQEPPEHVARWNVIVDGARLGRSLCGIAATITSFGAALSRHLLGLFLVYVSSQRLSLSIPART